MKVKGGTTEPPRARRRALAERWVAERCLWSIAAHGVGVRTAGMRCGADVSGRGRQPSRANGERGPTAFQGARAADPEGVGRCCLPQRVGRRCFGGAGNARRARGALGAAVREDRGVGGAGRRRRLRPGHPGAPRSASRVVARRGRNGAGTQPGGGAGDWAVSGVRRGGWARARWVGEGIPDAAFTWAFPWGHRVAMPAQRGVGAIGGGSAGQLRGLAGTGDAAGDV